MSDRPATEPRTKRGRKLMEDISHLVGPNQWTGFREEQVSLSIAAIEAEAAQGAAPLDQCNCACMECGGLDGIHCLQCASEGPAPRAEGLREALEHVLDMWPAPSPEEFARLHRVLTGHDSCSSRPSDEREGESDDR